MDHIAELPQSVLKERRAHLMKVGIGLDNSIRELQGIYYRGGFTGFETTLLDRLIREALVQLSNLVYEAGANREPKDGTTKPEAWRLRIEDARRTFNRECDQALGALEGQPWIRKPTA